MKERPILFNSEMVRAILKGRKRQTRRVIKPEWSRCLDFDYPEDQQKAVDQCPYGVIGDRLYVRETWVVPNSEGCAPRDITPGQKVFYRATDEYTWWRPSIHMPRWASRFTLEITDVRVERLKEISLHDINAEGTPDTLDRALRPFGSRREHFQRLWDSINSKRGYSWESNPWVWVIEFKVLEPASQS
jgi:hypothetical protein